MFKKIKLSKTQLLLIVLVILGMAFYFNNGFSIIKETFEVRTGRPCSKDDPCGDDTGDYTIGDIRIPHSHNPAHYSGADKTRDKKAYQHKKNLEHAIAHGWINEDGSESHVDTYFTELRKMNYGAALDSAGNVSASASII